MLGDPAINKIWSDQEEILANFASGQMAASSLLAPPPSHSLDHHHAKRRLSDTTPTPASSQFLSLSQNQPRCPPYRTGREARYLSVSTE